MTDKSFEYYDDCEREVRSSFFRLIAAGGGGSSGARVAIKRLKSEEEHFRATEIDVVEGGSPEYSLVDHHRFRLELLAPDGAQLLAFSIRDPWAIEYHQPGGAKIEGDWEHSVVVPLNYAGTVREVVMYDNNAFGVEAGRFDLGPAILSYCSGGGSEEICLGSDLDGDGTPDIGDICPLDVENDADGDGLCAGEDNCPTVFNPWQTDTDGDGFGDECDGCPFDADNDLDGDGVCGDVDNCPADANADQADFDGDMLGDACDPDVDGDGVFNESDQCPWTDLGAAVDPAGCSVDQLCPCDGPRSSGQPWRNHGKYVECVTDVTRDFVGLGLLSRKERAAVISAAARSDCGKN